MARPGVTYHDVANAAIELKAQGKYPTIENVRANLGTGSSSTIGPHLRNWRLSQDGQDKKVSKDNLPIELISLVKGLWERVNQMALEKITAVETNAEQIIQQFQQETKELQLTNQRWQAQYDQLKQTNQMLSVELEQIQATHHALKEEHTTLVGIRDSLAKQLEEKQIRIEELHRLHQQVQTNLEHYREAAREQRLLDQRKHEQREQQLEQTVHELRSNLKKYDKNIALLEQQQLNLTNDNSLLQESNKDLINQLSSTKESLLEVEKKYTKSTHDLQYLQMQSTGEQKKLVEQAQLIADLQTQLALLTQELSYSKKETANLSEQQKALAHEKWFLMQEKAQLEGQLKQLNQIVSNKNKN